MEEAASEPRAKRQKKERPGRAAAFEKLKKLKGSKYKYEINDLDDVYDVVDEKEYSKRVLNRQDDDWIVDDDGSGYIEDGRDIFDDDLDAKSIAAASSSKGKSKKKKAVSEQAGKGNLQYLLSNMPSKKKEVAKLGDDDILSELISEIDSTNSENTPRRVTIKPKPIVNFTMSAEKKAANDYMKSFVARKPQQVVHVPQERPVKTVKQIQKSCINEIEPMEEESISDTIIEIPSQKSEETEMPVIEEFQTQEEMFADDLDLSQIEEFNTEDIQEQTPKSDVTEEQLLNGWETMQVGTCNTTHLDINIDSSQIPLITNKDGNQVFRFYWWDAFENSMKRPGEVFLFGKTYCESAKAYVSCCVVVRNIERKIYLLPRTHVVDANREPTEKVVALIDVYHEFNESYAPYLTLQSFKSKKVTKNYCFDPDVPTQSEFLEIKYPDSQQQYQLGSEQENSTTVEELLISCVTARPPLWDLRLPIKERSKNIREQLWLEIYIEFGSNPQYSTGFLMKKWRNLRDTYVRLQSEYTVSGSAATKKKKWAYFDMLSFLKDTVGYKPTVSNVGVLSPSVSPTPEFETPHPSKRKCKEVEVPRIEGAIIEALQKVNAVQDQPNKPNMSENSRVVGANAATTPNSPRNKPSAVGL